MRPLPAIMVAPTGARLTRRDHPALPVSIPEIVETARACHAAGAGGIHAHVRDPEDRHVLDAGLYRELLDELDRALPGFYTQITTEAVGQFTPDEQTALLATLRPPAASVALREISGLGDPAKVAAVFRDCREAGTDVQHILYDEADIAALARLVAAHPDLAHDLKALIVLGRYTPGQRSAPADLAAPARALLDALPEADWAVCAFGPEETACLVAAAQLGGKARVGFENNRLRIDGTPAADNAERVAELVAALAADPPTD